jgi:hypothetical protein
MMVALGLSPRANSAFEPDTAVKAVKIIRRAFISPFCDKGEQQKLILGSQASGGEAIFTKWCIPDEPTPVRDPRH